jgi:hypothetical protein
LEGRLMQEVACGGVEAPDRLSRFQLHRTEIPGGFVKLYEQIRIDNQPITHVPGIALFRRDPFAKRNAIIKTLGHID